MHQHVLKEPGQSSCWHLPLHLSATPRGVASCPSRLDLAATVKPSLPLRADGPNPSCVSPMLTLARDSKAPTGCVLPVPRMWQELSASRPQMKGFLQCLDAQYGGKPKLPKVRPRKLREAWSAVTTDSTAPSSAQFGLPSCCDLRSIAELFPFAALPLRISYQSGEVPCL